MSEKIHRRRDADPREGLEKYGEATFADRVNKKYPIDSPGRIKAAWAYIHQPPAGGAAAPPHLAPRRLHRNFRRPSAGRPAPCLAPAAQLDRATAF
jgi:hypothetical protein